MEKIGILVTDNSPLYPPVWGGALRIYNLYSNFQNCQTSYVGLTRSITASDYQNKLNNNLSEVILKPDYKFYKLARFIELDGLTFDLYTYFLLFFDKRYNLALNNNSDNKKVLIASHPWGFSSLIKLKRKMQIKNYKSKPILVYDSHNVEYLLMKQILKNHPMRKILTFITRKIEKKACKKSDLIVTCSEEDKKNIIIEYGISPSKIFVFPNTIDIKRFQIKNQEKRKTIRKELGISLNEKIAFFVGAHYNPNIESVDYIIKNIAPKLPKITFLIAGGVKQEFEDKLKTNQIPKNVKFTGVISYEELPKMLLACDIAINPMFKGSGLHLKMLDYFASNLPTITTPIGARGLNLINGKHAIICDANKFTKEIEKLIYDSKKSSEIKKNAYEKVKEFDSKKIARLFERKLITLFKEIEKK